MEKGVELSGLTLAELRPFGEEFGEDFYSAITLDATLDCHDVIGGTARQRVQQALDAASERIAAVLESNVSKSTAAEAVHAGA
jgi:argininosuccinate lyase